MKGADGMKTATLVYWYNVNDPAVNGYVWQNSREQDITASYATHDEALANAPAGYKHIDISK